MKRMRLRLIVAVDIDGVPAADINLMAARANDPEYCSSPTGDHKHSESWYDCEPCDFCGDNSIPESCDCGKPGHAAGTK